MSTSTFEVSPSIYPVEAPEFIRIQPSKQRLNLDVRILEYVENEQIVLYIPSLEISGYGPTYIEAKSMLDESVKYFMNSLMKLSPDKIQLELTKLGWVKNKIKGKEYSKAYIDKNGILKNFDIDLDKVTEKKLDFAI